MSDWKKPPADRVVYQWEMPVDVSTAWVGFVCPGCGNRHEVQIRHVESGEMIDPEAFRRRMEKPKP